jgi:hypothetical protein
MTNLLFELYIHFNSEKFGAINYTYESPNVDHTFGKKHFSRFEQYLPLYRPLPDIQIDEIWCCLVCQSLSVDVFLA